MPGWTALVNRARQAARDRLEDDIRALGAEGAVIAEMRMHARDRDCPVAVGRRDHIVEVTLTGTPSSGSPPLTNHAGPVLTVTPMGTLPYQPAWARPGPGETPGHDEMASMSDNDAAGSTPQAEEPDQSPDEREPDSAQPAARPGYLTTTGETVGDDGSIVPIIGGLPAAEGSAWDIGAPADQRGAGLADELADEEDSYFKFA